MDQKADEPETAQGLKGKEMDPEKMAYVMKYLQDTQETHSVTTETSDSGYWTHTTASELGGKYNCARERLNFF